jgi:hypothetical protein
MWKLPSKIENLALKKNIYIYDLKKNFKFEYLEKYAGDLVDIL